MNTYKIYVKQDLWVTTTVQAGSLADALEDARNTLEWEDESPRENTGDFEIFIDDALIIKGDDF